MTTQIMSILEASGTAFVVVALGVLLWYAWLALSTNDDVGFVKALIGIAIFGYAGFVLCNHWWSGMPLGQQHLGCLRIFGAIFTFVAVVCLIAIAGMLAERVAARLREAGQPMMI